MVGRKYIYSFIFFLVLMMFLFYYLFSSMTAPATITSSEIDKNSIPSAIDSNNLDLENKKQPKEDLEVYRKYKFMSLSCNKKTRYCFYNNEKISIDTYIKLKNIFDVKELSISKKL